MGNNSSRGFGFNTGGGGGGGTDTNIANSNLTSDGSYATDLDGNNFHFKNGINKFFALESSTNAVSIGNTTPYTMPTARSGRVGEVIQSTDVTTGTDWKSTGFTLPFAMYIQACASENYHYPETMSNNKFLSLTRDSGITDPASWNVLTSSTVRSCTLGLANFQLEVGNLQFWGSTLDNLGSLVPKITVEIWKIPITEGVTTQLVPGRVATATTNATGDNNNAFYRGSGSGGEVAADNLMMPVFKLDYDGVAPSVINVDVWINGSIRCYYS